MPDARISVPPSVARGKPFEVRIIVRHPMETGYRTDESGKSIPRNVIQHASRAATTATSCSPRA